jgi:hypothetical protein
LFLLLLLIKLLSSAKIDLPLTVAALGSSDGFIKFAFCLSKGYSARDGASLENIKIYFQENSLSSGIDNKETNLTFASSPSPATGLARNRYGVYVHFRT